MESQPVPVPHFPMGAAHSRGRGDVSLRTVAHSRGREGFSLRGMSILRALTTRLEASITLKADTAEGRGDPRRDLKVKAQC